MRPEAKEKRVRLVLPAALLVGAMLVGAMLAPALLTGQTLARQVAQTTDGTVRLSYPAREDVQICDQGIKMGEHEMMWRSHGRDEEPTNCRWGPVEIEVEVRGGSIRGIEVIRRIQDRKGCLLYTSDAADDSVLV